MTGFTRLEYCPNCKNGYEFIGSGSPLPCLDCRGPRELIYQTDDTTTPEEFKAVKEQFIERLKREKNRKKNQDIMEELDFNPLQEIINNLQDEIAGLNDLIDNQSDKIASLEQEVAELGIDITNRERALLEIRRLADDYV